jgi:homoserine kinase
MNEIDSELLLGVTMIRGKRAMKIKVRVPATSANCGPGFDCIGLALDIYSTLELELKPEPGLDITLTGEGAKYIPTDERNIVWRSIKVLLEKAGMDNLYQGAVITMDNQGPMSRGLGSSATAIVAGLKAANTIIGNPYDRKELLQIATEIEGHPDNVAPAIYGGFTISTVNDLGVECFAFRPKCNLQFVVAVPDFPLPTREARSVLPKMVKMSDAIYNIGRASMMVAALCRGNVRFLKNVFDDKLHQPFRAELIPGMYDVFEAARKAGAVGACLSGAGPSIIAFIDEERDNAERVGEAMRTAFVRHDVKAAILKPHLDTRGAYIVNDPLG